MVGEEREGERGRERDKFNRVKREGERRDEFNRVWKLQTDLHIGGLAASAGKTD